MALLFAHVLDYRAASDSATNLTVVATQGNIVVTRCVTNAARVITLKLIVQNFCEYYIHETLFGK